MRLDLILAFAALATPALASQHPKRAKKPNAAPPPPAAASAKAAPGFVREAPCTLTLKGTITRQAMIPKEGLTQNPEVRSPGGRGKAGTTSQTLERFDYEFPGTLQEEDLPGGAVRFHFKPAVDPVGEGARASLHMEDTQAGASAPTIVEASELTAVQPFIFEAAARGQGIVPVTGQVYLRGRLQSPLPAGKPMSMEAPVRPVVSIPLPQVPKQFAKDAPAAMRFQGISLWGWANSPKAFTVAATQDYQLKSDLGSVVGSVAITFRVGDTRKPDSKK